MRKITTILSLVFFVGVLAFGFIVPDQAWATNDGLPELIPPDDSEFCNDIIFEQNDGPNDGTDGDPDSAGDGFGFMGNDFFDGFDIGEVTCEELLALYLAQLIPAP